MLKGLRFRTTKTNEDRVLRLRSSFSSNPLETNERLQWTFHVLYLNNIDDHDHAGHEGGKLNMADSGNKFSGVLKRSLSDTAEALLFTDENHGSTILKGLFASYKDGKYVDISLKIGPERTLRAHRAVLASFSPYFEALLGDNWKEGNKEEIEILGLDEGAVSDLIEFAYTGKIKIDKDNVLTLLEAANYLGIESVKKSCGNFLEQGVDTKCCLGILQLADMFALDELSSFAKKYALRHFTDVCKEDEFLCLPVNFLSDLLSEENLVVVVEDLIPCVEEREKTVLESVLQYVEHDVENRKTHLAHLLGLVRLPTLSTEYLAEVSRNKLLECEFGDILEKAKNLKLHPPEEVEMTKWENILEHQQKKQKSKTKTTLSRT